LVIERANTIRGSINICCPFSPPVGENNGDGGRIMIDKVGDVYILTCDICGEEADEDFGYFYDAVEYKSKMGWKNQRNSAGHWEEVCPECQEAE